jgi:hypothetical protein
MLTKLEEFVSTRDELYLATQADGSYEPEVWTLWPNIRRLALYNVYATPEFWHNVASMPLLDSVVLTRADGIEDICIKTPFFEKADRPMKVVIANYASGHAAMPRQNWKEEQRRMRVIKYDVQATDEDESIEACQEWIRDRATDGTLWDLDGELLEGEGDASVSS